MNRIEIIEAKGLHLFRGTSSGETTSRRNKFEVDQDIYSLRMGLHSGRIPNNLYYDRIKPLRKIAREMNRGGRRW